jgi:pyruvate,water dikinase
VRSSAVDEDGADASFAGQHETFLNVAGSSAVVETIQRCWRSFTAPHAIEYRRRQGLPVEAVRVAVLVQQLVVADAAAVAFTADPVTGSRESIVINASWGLGESIVGGTVTPDVYVVRAQDFRVVSREIAEKRRMTVAVPGGTIEVNTPAFLARRPALTDDEAAAVARLAHALEAESGCAVDVECALSGGELFLLQCRPITTLGRSHSAPMPQPAAREVAPERAGTETLGSAPANAGIRIEPAADFPTTWERPEDERLHWTLDRVHWPDPIPPLVFAVAGDAVASGLSAAARAYEQPIAEVRVQRINTYRYQTSVPLNGSPAELEAGRTRYDVNLHAAMGRLRTAWADTWLPEVQEHLTYWDGFDLAGAALPALLDHLDQSFARVRRLWEIHFLLASPMHGAISALGRLYRDLFGGSALHAFQLLQGYENKTLLAGRAMWYLSRLAAARQEVRAALESDTEPLAALERSEYGRDFIVELRSYLGEYGQRGETLYLDRPSWADDPTPVLEQIRGLLRREDRDVVAELVASWDERDQLVREARLHLAGYPALVRDEFEFLLAAAQDAVALTENHNFWIDAHGMQRVRRVFLEFGRRLASLDALAKPQDVFFLTEYELRESCANPANADLRELVTVRQEEVERFRAVAAPAELGTRPAGDRLTRAEPASDGQSLRGHAASAGVVRGVARVLHSLDEASRLEPGEVLVAETLSSSWTPLFVTAAAAVTDTGGILSHAAVVAREYRLPAVLGVEGATSRISDGQMVEVDGDHGLVRVLSDATPATCSTETTL